MRSELFNLIKKYNYPEKGLLIQSDLIEYVDKILKNATILTYQQNGLKAFIAFYCNDIINYNAYLSLILLDEEVKGKGVGKFLLSTSIKILKKKGFKNYGLEVLKNNDKAIKLYQSSGFEIVNENHLFYKMTKLI
ncbi:GNAT family N-acetyltransferase [Aequorivita aquimaris]|uniref:GNAT family N-acetyltransferase n=1 Tax=Aequorivita aquimaris TaxID=1548749 RepID=UPI000787241C|nr:N-acetyltransferase [Aequorivita aquimaris]